MNTKSILAALFGVAVLPSQAASDLNNALNTYSGNSQQNGNGAAQPVFLTGDPLAEPPIPAAGLEVSFLAGGFAAAGAYETIYFNDTSAILPEVPGVKFGGNRLGNDGRNYMRTVEADYYTQDFTAYITVKRSAPTDGTNRRSAFFGIGTGARNGGFNNNPDQGTTNASAYVELQNGHNNASRRAASNSNSNQELGWTPMTTVSDDSMRLRMQYNSVTRTITYSFDYAHVPGEAFVADQTLASNVINTQFNEWVGGDRASIYFGGDRSVVFTDLVIDVTQPATPPTPSGLALVSVGDAEVNLQWSSFAIPGTTFSVYRSTTAGEFNDPAIAPGLEAMSYTDTAVANGTTYFYRVTQSNTVAANPESAPSNEISVTPVAGAVTPDGVVARNAGDNVLVVDWNDLLSPFDSYKVYRATAAEGPFSLIAGGLAASIYTDETVVSGTSYFYQVTSILGAQESAPSAASSAAVPALLEVFADFNAAAVNSGRGVLGAGTGETWNNDTGNSVPSDKLNDSSGVVTALALEGASNFGVFSAGAGANVGGDPATLVANYNLMQDYRFTDGAIRNYTFTGLAPNRTYDLYLFGYGGDIFQNSAFDVGGIVKQTTSPLGLTTLTEGRHYVTFTFVSQADGSFLFRWGTPGNLGLIDAHPAGGSGFNGFQLVENPTAVLQPLNLSATGTTAAVDLDWNDVSGATSYKVYRSATPASDYTLLADSVATSDYSDTTAVPGTPYYYVVTALNGTVESFTSAEASGTRVPLIIDADSDGLSDADEAIIGTDPNDPNDFFVTTASAVTPAAGNYNVSFVINGAEGDYVIERSTTLAEGSWVEIPGSKVSWTWTTGVLDNLTLSAPDLTPDPGGKEFFRAKGVVPAPQN